MSNKEIVNGGTYIIDWTYDFHDIRLGEKVTHTIRVVAEAAVSERYDNSIYIQWMHMGMDYHSLIHDEDDIKVIAFIDVDQCTCVPFIGDDGNRDNSNIKSFSDEGKVSSEGSGPDEQVRGGE